VGGWCSLLCDRGVPTNGATEVLGHDGHVRFVIGSQPTAYCFGRKAAVAERTDEHATRLYDSGYFFEHLDWLREVVDRHATDSRRERSIDEGERWHWQVVEVEANDLVSHRVRCEFSGVHPEDAERHWFAREVRNPRRHEIKDRAGVWPTQTEFLIERSNGCDGAIIDMRHQPGVVIEPIIGCGVGSIEEAVWKTLVSITHLAKVARRSRPLGGGRKVGKKRNAAKCAGPKAAMHSSVSVLRTTSGSRR
jgi:hypothetical protein